MDDPYGFIGSNFDDSFNYTFGYYWYDDTTDNEYRVQTMGTQLIGDFGAHPYAPVLFGLTGLDYSNKGGFAFYDQLLRLMAVIPSVQQVQAGLITDPATAQGILTAYGTLVATINAMPDMTVPVDLRGTLSDQHVRTKSQALYGELYFDLNENTMLTVGARYDDFLVDSSNFNDLVGRQYVARGGNAYANPGGIRSLVPMFSNYLDQPSTTEQLTYAVDFKTQNSGGLGTASYGACGSITVLEIT